MKFTQADIGSGHLILSYEPGQVLIDGTSYRDALILSPDRIVPEWGPRSAEDLAARHFEVLLELEPQVVILGTGERQVFPDPRVYLAALQRGLGVEIMDTGAACRTYNILMAEGRKVAAGLILC